MGGWVWHANRSRALCDVMWWCPLAVSLEIASFSSSSYFFLLYNIHNWWMDIAAANYCSQTNKQTAGGGLEVDKCSRRQLECKEQESTAAINIIGLHLCMNIPWAFVQRPRPPSLRPRRVQGLRWLDGPSLKCAYTQTTTTHCLFFFFFSLGRLRRCRLIDLNYSWIFSSTTKKEEEEEEWWGAAGEVCSSGDNHQEE